MYVYIRYKNEVLGVKGRLLGRLSHAFETFIIICSFIIADLLSSQCLSGSIHSGGFVLSCKVAPKIFIIRIKPAMIEIRRALR